MQKKIKVYELSSITITIDNCEIISVNNFAQVKLYFYICQLLSYTMIEIKLMRIEFISIEKRKKDLIRNWILLIENLHYKLLRIQCLEV